MLTSYLRQIFHDRRRIAVATTLTLAGSGFANGFVPPPAPMTAAMAPTLCFLLLIPLFTARLKAHRHWIEIIALGLFSVTLTRWLYPGGIFGWHGPAFLLAVQGPAVIGVFLGLRLVIHGHWSDRFSPRHPYLVETTLRSHLSLQELWYGFVPTPGFADRNPDRAVVSVEFADATKQVVRLTTWEPPHAGSGEILLDFAEITALEHVRFRLKVMRGLHDPCEEGETEIFFEDRGSHRRLHVRHLVEGFTARRALLGTFDDTFGRTMTARLNAIETRVATGRPAKAETGFDTWCRTCVVEPTGEADASGYRTAYGRHHSAAETEALQDLGQI